MTAALSSADRSSSTRIGWVVDVQFDFMRSPEEGGRLYVHDLVTPGDPGARLIVPALVDTVRWMRANCAVTVFTGDWHRDDDPEIDRVAPDPARGTYPAHCMGAGADLVERAGAAIIPEVAPDAPLVLSRDATPEDGRTIALEAVRTGRAVFIQKSRFSVFEGNPAVRAFVAGLREALGLEAQTPLDIDVCGVATEVCVDAAVVGFCDPGLGTRVTVVRDAIWGLGLREPAEVQADWAARGAQFTTRTRLLSQLGEIEPAARLVAAQTGTALVSIACNPTTGAVEIQGGPGVSGGWDTWIPAVARDAFERELGRPVTLIVRHASPMWDGQRCEPRTADDAEARRAMPGRGR